MDSFVNSSRYKIVIICHLLFLLSCSEKQELVELKSNLSRNEAKHENKDSRTLKSINIEGDVNSIISFEYNDSLQLTAFRLLIYDKDKQVKQDANVRLGYKKKNILDYLYISGISLGRKYEDKLSLEYNNGQYSSQVENQGTLFGKYNGLLFSENSSGFIDNIRYVNTNRVEDNYSMDYSYTNHGDIINHINLSDKGSFKRLISAFSSYKIYTNPVKFTFAMNPILSDLFLREFPEPFYALFVCLKPGRYLPKKQLFDVSYGIDRYFNADTIIVEVIEGIDPKEAIDYPLKVKVTHTGLDLSKQYRVYSYTINYHY